MAYSLWDEARLHQQANRLDRLAAEYDEMIQELRTYTAPLHSQWESPARDAWVAKRDTLLGEAAGTAAEIRSIAAGIRSYTASMHYLLEEIVETVTGKVD